MPGTFKAPIGRAVPTNGREWARLFGELPVEFLKNGQTDYDTGTGYFLGDHNGVPKLSLGNSAGNKVTWDGSTLSIVGTVTATTGTIGGWTLAATYLSSGSGANTVRLDSAGTNPAISAGSATPASAPFRVTQAGALVATSATITGTVTSTAGAIGGWTLSATALTSGSGATTVGLDSGGTNPALYAGSATPASAPFRVTQAGALTATSATITGTVTSTAGTIGGWTLGTTSLTSGSGATTVGVDSGGTNPAFYAGSATPGSAPFRVTQAGALTASSATITGTVTLTNSATTFAPTWTGFSTDPTGNFSYIDFGSYVLLFSAITAAGNSNATTMSISNLPSGIRPSDVRTAVTVVVNNSVAEVGYANVATDGNVYFFRDAAASYTTGDVPKNWPGGATLIYPK